MIERYNDRKILTKFIIVNKKKNYTRAIDAIAV